jgi:hypothetical protein
LGKVRDRAFTMANRLISTLKLLESNFTKSVRNRYRQTADGLL